MADDDEKTTIYGTLLEERDLSYLVKTTVGEVWIPRSQVSRLLRMPENVVEMDIPAWLADKKGLG